MLKFQRHGFTRSNRIFRSFVALKSTHANSLPFFGSTLNTLRARIIVVWLSNIATWCVLAPSMLKLATSPPNKTLSTNKVFISQKPRNLNVQGTVNPWIDQQLYDCLEGSLECVYSGPIVLQQIEAYLSALHL